MIDHLKNVSRKLKKAANWNGTTLHVDAKCDSFVYELTCYFRAATSVSNSYGVQVAGKLLRSGSGHVKARWPMGPGKKSNFSFLHILDDSNGTVAYQLCPGVNVADRHGKDRAVDINLLKHSTGDNPKYRDLLGVWDAKHSIKPSSRLPDSAVSDFVFTFEQLGSPQCPTDWSAASAETAFRSSGLLTNAKASTEPDATLVARSVSETAQYPDRPKTRP